MVAETLSSKFKSSPRVESRRVEKFDLQVKKLSNECVGVKVEHFGNEFELPHMLEQGRTKYGSFDLIGSDFDGVVGPANLRFLIRKPGPEEIRRRMKLLQEIAAYAEKELFIFSARFSGGAALLEAGYRNNPLLALQALCRLNMGHFGQGKETIGLDQETIQSLQLSLDGRELIGDFPYALPQKVENLIEELKQSQPGPSIDGLFSIRKMFEPEMIVRKFVDKIKVITQKRNQNTTS